MLRERAYGVFAMSLLSSLGLGQVVACSSPSADGDRAGVNGTGGATGATGGAASGGQGTGGAGAGGAGTGGASVRDAGADATADATDGSLGSAPACRGSTPRLGTDGTPTGFETCEGGSVHRPNVKACASALPRSTSCESPPPDGAAGCRTDADCTAAPDGFCAPQGGSPYCGCHYGCRADADCGDGFVCVCDDPVGRCVSATCTSDADCGDGLLCLSYEAGCGWGFACQTKDDSCASHADCTGSLCDLVDGVHACRPQSCVDGRPFLVGGAARVAPVARTETWCSPLAPDVSNLGEAERAAAGARWTEVALMEHASIAAFARFALELMALGAPPELILATQAAMADETGHARDAFALASAYLGRPVGPGPLDVTGALGASTPLDVVRSTILEGCIGETVAALEATAALEAATDPAVRAALGRVVEEEARHAELAHRFVQWVLVHGERRLARAAARELVALAEHEAQLAAAAAASAAPPARNTVLLAHGVVDASDRASIRARALRDVVVPCARALAESVRPGLVAAAQSAQAAPALV